jgi:hypothetical protein
MNIHRKINIYNTPCYEYSSQDKYLPVMNIHDIKVL